jgi:hypothetical protein
VVESVEELDAKLEVLALCNVEYLSERKIGGYSTRSDQNVLSGITRGVPCWD